MILGIIRAVIRFRALVWLLIGAASLVSVLAIRSASLDAIPDISDAQIVVYVKWPRSPQLLETEVTEVQRGEMPSIEEILPESQRCRSKRSDFSERLIT